MARPASLGRFFPNAYIWFDPNVDLTVLLTREFRLFVPAMIHALKARAKEPKSLMSGSDAMPQKSYIVRTTIIPGSSSSRQKRISI